MADNGRGQEQNTALVLSLKPYLLITVSIATATATPTPEHGRSNSPAGGNDGHHDEVDAGHRLDCRPITA
ncbi:UNVERIFIED_CONTAM: hypothetical protein Sradi_0479500 [Sesamum radiatum]|uniref:Uncharacterized protein n=1 Tax=Sesamum radiatum TaxID=300843 RepID=A0AAW2WAG2_SESRA